MDPKLQPPYAQPTGQVYSTAPINGGGPVPPQYQYAQQPGYPPQSGQQVVVIQQQQQGTPVGLILFLVGWCFPITWFVGCCVPGCSNVPAHERGWQIANRVMAAVMVIVIIIIIAVTASAARAVQTSVNNAGPMPQ